MNVLAVSQQPTVPVLVVSCQTHQGFAAAHMRDTSFMSSLFEVKGTGTAWVCLRLRL